MDQAVVGSKDGGPVAGDDTVDLLIDLVLVERTFEALVPAFGLNLALCIDFGRLAGRGDAGIDRGLAFLVTLVFLQKKTTLKVVRGNRTAWFWDKLNVFSTGMLQSKMMQISEIELNRDLFSVRAKKVTIKA